MKRSSLPSARQVSVNVGGKWHGSYGTAACPLCQYEQRGDQNALTITDGAKGLLMHCKKSGCTFKDLLMTPRCAEILKNIDVSDYMPSPPPSDADAVKRSNQVRAIWDESKPLGGTLAETYLRHRSIICALPETLRFHANCWHLSGHHHPAMIARVESVSGFAIHRTYLRPDGLGKADVTPSKMMLGNTKGGGVLLSEGYRKIVVTEGIETGLSLLCGALQEPASVVACLSAAGMRSLRLPLDPGRLTLASDGDAAGRSAAFALACRARDAGWRVFNLPAPEGLDWNDVLLSNGRWAK
jgi:hypothetical protein